MSLLQTLTRPLKKIRRTQKQVAKWISIAEAVRPVARFDQLPAPMVPDYSHLGNWAAHPELEDKSNFTPKGVDVPNTPLQADVFYLHPTTYFGKSSWNAPIDHALSREFIDEVIIPSQASVFNGHCRIFAPRYRQATFFSFLEGGKNAEKALELAFSDIVRAFDYYIKNENNGRPFFIAGHSQGALHGIRLLEQRIEKSDLHQQLIAAYIVGFRFPADKFQTTLRNIQPGIKPNQTGCVVAWDTFIEGGKPSRRLENRMHWYPTEDGKGRWEKCGSKNPFGVNPLNWKVTYETVEAAQNEGAVHTDFGGKMPPIDKMWDNKPTKMICTGLSAPYKHEVGATLKKDGFLYISKPINRIFRTVLLPRGDFHMYDIALFHMNMRENIGVRLAAFFRNK